MKLKRLFLFFVFAISLFALSACDNRQTFVVNLVFDTVTPLDGADEEAKEYLKTLNTQIEVKDGDIITLEMLGITFPKIVTDNFVFDGWTQEGYTASTKEFKCISDVTLNATFGLAKRIVTFDVGDGTFIRLDENASGRSVGTAQIDKRHLDNLAYLSNFAAKPADGTSNYFVGWSLTPDGEIAQHLDGFRDVTFYAVYKDVKDSFVFTPVDGGYALTFCENAPVVTVPATYNSKPVVGIEGAFRNRIYMQQVTLPDSVTALGEDAFFSCAALKQISLPQGLTDIGRFAFYGCASLEEVVLPQGLKNIGFGAFYNCTNLAGVTLPDGLQSLGGSAFAYCANLIGVALPDNITTLFDYTFLNCEKLASVILPDGLTEIGEYAFANCASLTDIALPDGLVNLGSCAFFGCANLAAINLPDGVTVVNDGTFRGCKWLSSVTLPNTLTEIGAYAFCDCTFLLQIDIPNGCTVADNAFDGTGLKHFSQS